VASDRLGPSVRMLPLASRNSPPVVQKKSSTASYGALRNPRPDRSKGAFLWSGERFCDVTISSKVFGTATPSSGQILVYIEMK